jgi:hypothetical protein
MRSIAIALVAGVTLSAGAAYAQSIHIGPDGVQLRDRDRDRYEYRSDRRYYDDDDMTTGAIRRGCRTVVIRERDEYGDVSTRRVRRCR